MYHANVNVNLMEENVIQINQKWDNGKCTKQVYKISNM